MPRSEKKFKRSNPSGFDANFKIVNQIRFCLVDPPGRLNFQVVADLQGELEISMSSVSKLSFLTAESSSGGAEASLGSLASKPT